MNSTNITHAPSEHKLNLDACRHYLAAVESVAHQGSTSNDPAEVIAAIQLFVAPSDALRRLADKSRKVF